MPTDLTARQRAILACIRETVTARGYPPSMREIGAAVGLSSTSSVRYQLGELQAGGWIRRDPGLPRALCVLNPDQPAEDQEITS